MRVPTGMHQVQTILSSHDYIFYKCENCGNYHLAAKEVKGGGFSDYHVLQSDAKKEQTNVVSAQNASASLAKNSANNANLINNLKDYSPITEEIICPDCQAVQTWSKWPKKWNATKSGTALIICLIAIPFVCPWFLLISPIAALLALLALVFIPLGFVLSYSSKRKRIIAELNSRTVNRPIYIYSGNTQAVMNSAEGQIIAEILSKQDN